MANLCLKLWQTFASSWAPDRDASSNDPADCQAPALAASTVVVGKPPRRAGFLWLEGFDQALASLAQNPERCTLARESDAFRIELRELHYGLRSKATHRAIYSIHRDEVIVYAVRHLAQQELTPQELGQPPAR